RHFGWDNGTLLANLLAVATARGLPAKVVCGFVDATVNRLLDVDSEREVAFSLVALGYDSGLSAQKAPRAPAELSPLGFETVPLSRHEIDYPLCAKCTLPPRSIQPKKLQPGASIFRQGGPIRN